MVFAADGRSLVCEKCGYHHPINRKRRPPQEIAELRSSSISSNGEPTRFRANVRDILVQGIAAAKAGDLDDAHFYLEWVLRKPATNEEQAQAWFWLSEIYSDPSEKRECLVQTLALDPYNALARREIAVLDGRLDEADIIDPNRIASVTDGDPLPTQARIFQCPRCSGRMHFTPDGQQLLCEFCDYREDMNVESGGEGRPEEDGAWGMEQDFIVGLATAKGHLKPILMRSMHCQGCGIEFVLAPETLSVICPYCDSAYVTETAEDCITIPPQALIPFSKTQEEAGRALNEWLEQHEIRRVAASQATGLYYPAWTFDLTGEITWRGLEARGDNWVSVSGAYYVLRDDLLLSATRKTSPQMKLAFKDFDLEQVVQYDARYLAAWPAERHQLSLADASIAARKQLLDELRGDSRKVTSGRTVRELLLNSSGLTVHSYKLILLPFWIAHYEIEGIRYEVSINGQSGRVRGEREIGAVGKLISWFRGV